VGTLSPEHTGIMEGEPDSVRSKLIAASKTRRQVFANIIPDLRALVGIVIAAYWSARTKSEVFQSGDEGFIFPADLEIHLSGT
jgi:hypothetical protein